jgi:redox-sensitive bicupin YhaK (pirin superfamily)
MSAGSGIVHAEFNASASEVCHLLQIWIMPSKNGIAPGYEQKKIEPDTIANHFARIAGPEPAANEVRLVQDAEIWAARLDAENEAVHNLRPGRKAWLQVVKGEVSVGEEILNAGDAAALTDMTQIQVRSRALSEVLLFDLA